MLGISATDSDLRGAVLATLLLATLLLTALPAGADGGVSYTDIAAGGGSGLIYEREPSDSIAVFNSFAAQPILPPEDWPLTPEKPFGAPGVALLDYDGDADLDIYVTNGPMTANSLFQNQLAQTGTTTFVDVALSAGVDASSQDSTGVCFGDIDNDGDPYLLVVGNIQESRLLENNGDGTFADISVFSGIGGLGMNSVSCSMGDINGDGLLDMAIANNSVDMSNSQAIVTPFEFNQPNQLLLNLGGNQFQDVSASSGFLDTSGFTPPNDGEPTLTWAIAMVDIDLDGDIDILQADDQAGVPFAIFDGVDRGLIQFFENDGTGTFTNRTAAAGLNTPGQWMGLSFGDLNEDGHMDIFASNAGDYNVTLLTPLDPVWLDSAFYTVGEQSTRWFLGSASGVFSDPGVGPLVATPFGWGTAMMDYDNDADTDLLYHGGLYFGPVGQGCPAALLKNDGTATFARDSAAFAGSTDHQTRTVQGVATGDLDGNGFVDFVTVSNFDVLASEQFTYNHNWGGPFDGGRYSRIFTPTGDFSGESFFSGQQILKGSLSVELSSGGNGNDSVTVRTLGTVDLTSNGVVNRDGIGAVITFRTASGDSTLRPVLGGSSYASQDSLSMLFGLGSDAFGQVEILWPGGVRNRLYYVKAGESLLFPEIPCSFDGHYANPGAYLRCVNKALKELVREGVITRQMKVRFFISALRAFLYP